MEQLAGHLSQPSDSLDSVPVFSSMDTREEAGEEKWYVPSNFLFVHVGEV